MTDLEVVNMLLPHIPEYYKLVMVSWLNHHGQLINASHVKMLYRYMLGHISYEALVNHFDLVEDLEAFEEIIP